jgi:type IV secretion system protein VirB11
MSFAPSPPAASAGEAAAAGLKGSRPPAVVESSALDLTLRALRPLLTDRAVTELCINRPGEAYVETREGWRCVPLAFASYEWCLGLAKLVANSTQQRIDAESPLLSGSLPGGERIQIVLPPATTPRTVAITIRRPADELWTLDELAQRGIFRATQNAGERTDETDLELLKLRDGKDYRSFMRLAVASRKNILVSGPTGSGKTTFTKALIREIAGDERLITIEDAKELVLDRHPNHVRLFYSKDDQGLARVTPKQLLESCLRMKPDRILLAELRGEEAFDYLRNVNSGHPGSITSIHAASAELAFEQLVLLVKQSRAGQELAREEIKTLLYLLIDVVVQFGVEHRERCIREVWYEPTRKHSRVAAAS